MFKNYPAVDVIALNDVTTLSYYSSMPEKIESLTLFVKEQERLDISLNSPVINVSTSKITTFSIIALSLGVLALSVFSLTGLVETNVLYQN